MTQRLNIGVSLTITAIALAVMAWIVYTATTAKNRVVKNGTLTSGTIFKCTRYPRSGKITFSYSFQRNAHQVVGSSLLYGGFTTTDCKEHFIGRSFPVIYDSIHPNDNDMLIDSISFRKYNIPFPDSLKWIYNYMPGQDDPQT